MSTSSASDDPAVQFGPNEWLVEEMYEQFLADPSAVDPAWHDFFVDYQPAPRTNNGWAATDREPDTDSTSTETPTGTGTRAPRDAGSRTQRGNGSRTSASSWRPEGPQPKATQQRATPREPTQKEPTQKETIQKETIQKETVEQEASPRRPAARQTPARETTPRPSRPRQTRPAPTRLTQTRSGQTPTRETPRQETTSAQRPGPTKAPPTGSSTDRAAPLRGAAARVVANMETSLELPTATSVRAVPAKLLEDNRIVINNHLRRTRGGKISFTHLIGYAVVRALTRHPEMNRHYTTDQRNSPAVVTPEHVNLGLAIDLQTDKGRNLVVASIKAAETLSFAQFWQSYEDIIRRARDGKLTTDDFAGTTITLTNPGTLGTNHSVPRLMAGQGAIIGVGAIEHPAAFQGASDETLAELAISKIITLTSTYDHRIIQGAESGDFLRRVHQLLLGEDGFYDEVFTSLRIPYEPVRWVQDIPEGAVDKTARVLELIDAYRTRGHLMADTDPLNYRQRKHPDLDVLQHGLTLWDLDREFAVGGFGGQSHMKLRDVLGVLRNSYCRNVGVEYMHILAPDERQWLQERVERVHGNLSHAEQKYILSKLNAAESFETFLQTKYVGQKRFSLEGAETVIPVLDAVLDKAAEFELDEVVLGMPHRGRLNVLANVVGKPYSQIFREFEGNLDPGQAHGSGDVKYHLGAEGKYYRMFGDGETKVTLTSNPSHLEAVDPVLEGIVRAKQDILDKGQQGFTVLPVLLHGDAAFAGQGVVAETLNLSLLRGYRTGGTVHVIVNNQVGFTTAPLHARSSEYSTDVAKMIGAPVFHVNGDDPESCVWVAKLAVEYRQAFGKDVVIDMVCYRRRGHNEGDDPSMTQPAMYDVIDTKRSVRKGYTEALIGRGDISVEEAERALKDYAQQLEHVFNEVRELEKHPPAPSESVETEQIVPATLSTAVDRSVIERIADAHINLPEGFTVHPRVVPVLEKRAKMAREGGVDWAFAELLAFGSLCLDGRLVRLAGQDSRRGTFVQRHSVLIDRKTGAEYTPLMHLGPDQAKFLAYDSALSEFAALGFEYGYSVANSDALVVWEAQFGDFLNGAQPIIDEFISSGEAKWGQHSDVVLLLPHGHEGQGPDHTSGRIERFLQLCAEGSMTVAQPSTPANYFHLLRRHALDGVHRPLVVFTPKSMLRLRAAVSPVEDFTSGRFGSVLADPTVANPSAVRRILLCSGKIGYELNAARQKRGRHDVAIVRIEQLYPVPKRRLAEALERYPNATEIRWVQEEPANQGAWPFYGLHLPELIPERLGQIMRVSRRAMAAPSAGSAKVHEVEQAEVITAALE